LAAKVAITLEAGHAVDVLEQALKHYGRPELVNTDQGCQLSRDGRAWRDNVLVERLWRSVKYARVYLHAYDSVGQARASMLDYVEWYNHQRPHSGLNRKTPHQAYNDWLPTLKRAA